jgi:NADH-quinone oxidoreductase subunit H
MLLELILDYELPIKIGIMLGGVMTAAAYFVLLERRMAAWIQDRIGPNRVGIPLTKIKLFGLGQPLADGLKFIMKEEYTPSHVDKQMFRLAPLVMLTAALAVFAVIPFGSVIPPLLDGEPIELVIAPGIDVGLIYIFALSSIAVYGVILGGWASNNKYSFLGGLRSSAQLIAYELPLGLGILGVVAATGSLNLQDIIQHQAERGLWFAIAQPMGFVVFVTAAFAEAARLPFDLPECEQELIGGYHTEYSGMKLLLFLVAEFVHMVTAAFLIVMLFLGGWHFWGITGWENNIGWLTAFIRVIVLCVKIFLVVAFFMLVRWSWPRFRFDQLMNLAWKVMLPMGIFNLMAITFFDQIGRLFIVPLFNDRHFGEVAASWMMVIPSALVFVAALFVIAKSHPHVVDNRPHGSFSPGIDSQL